MTGTNRPLVCVTVAGRSMTELRAERDAAGDADLVELRLDSVADPDVAGALEGRRRPVIVTCRPVWEGGQFSGSEEERRRLLGQALAAGAEYIDVEWRANFGDLLERTGGRRIILSTHDFKAVPSDLVPRARTMRATGAEVVKIAVRANRLTDCLRLRDLRSELAAPCRAVLIAMGECGLASRVLAEHFGSVWVYAGRAAAVGQVPASTLLGRYRFRSIGSSTAVYGVAGRPVGHSLSPAIHNAALREAAIDAAYLPLPAQDLDDFVGFARGLPLAGASITIPYKIAVLKRLDVVDDTARQIGAVNTLRIASGRWEGWNTDAPGFLQPLADRQVHLSGLRVAVMGAGGSARAAAAALAPKGARVAIHARNRRAAREVARLAGATVGVWPPPAGSWDLLVNCTPVGMHPHVDESPVPGGSLTGQWVYDLVYNPAETRLLREAAAAGCHTLNGLDMLVAQAQEQFQIWTGQRPDAAVMRAAALDHLSEFAADETYDV